jgi:hypothetical protein
MVMGRSHCEEAAMASAMLCRPTKQSPAIPGMEQDLEESLKALKFPYLHRKLIRTTN